MREFGGRKEKGEMKWLHCKYQKQDLKCKKRTVVEGN